MRIAYLLTHPIQYQSPLVRHLRAGGVDIVVLYGPMAAESEASDPELGRHEPWDLPLLEGYPHVFVSAAFSSGALGFLALRRRLRECLREVRADAVWIHGWGNAYCVAGWAAAVELGLPVLLRGEAHLKCLRGGRLRKWLHKKVLSLCFRSVAQFLAIGSANRQFYQSYGVPECRITDVPYAVDNGRFARATDEVLNQVDEWRQRLGIHETDTVIGFFGKLKSVKRPDLTLRAVAMAASQLPDHRQPWLLFVGDGPERSSLERLARETYSKRCVFLGFQNQTRLPALYRLMDLLVLPSAFEPWGLVVNEAMCAGCAVVVSDRVGAGADLVQGAPEVGGVFPSDNLDELRDLLGQFLADETRLRCAGKSAATRIRCWDFEADLQGLRKAVATLPEVQRMPETVRHDVVAAYLGVHEVFQMAAAAAEAGRLEHLYCSMIGFAGRVGHFLSRWFFIPSVLPLGAEVLPPVRVSELPLPLLVQRTAERLLRPRSVSPMHTNRWFAGQVARRLAGHPQAGIVVGAETCALEFFLAARQRGMRCVLDCHGIPTKFLQDGLARAAEELGLNCPPLLDAWEMSERKADERSLADVMVLCSELQRQIYLSEGVPADKMRVVPLWVDTDFWRTPAAPLRTRRGGRLRVLFAGAGSLAKGLPYLLSAVNRVGEAAVELTLVGRMHPDMRMLLGGLRVPLQTHDYCSKEKLRELYWNHDVLVLPSLGESFGFVAVEAMACGLPVIVTDRCGAPVPDPAWRVEAFSASAIAARLTAYLETPDQLESDGQQAASFAASYTSARYRQSVQRIYEELRPGFLSRVG